jgi:hypothetical protein
LDGIGGIDRITLLVAGFNEDGSHEVYTCIIPGEVQKKRDSREKNKDHGASWIGRRKRNRFRLKNILSLRATVGSVAISSYTAGQASRLSLLNENEK